MLQRQSVRAIIINNNALLTMKRNKFGKEYYTLIGGGIDVGEDAETALRREIREEASLEVGDVRPVFVEDAGSIYGEQYIYLCEYTSGEPVLSTESEESKISALGQNLYQPEWLPIDCLESVKFLSSSVRDAIVSALAQGFPDQPTRIEWKD